MVSSLPDAPHLILNIYLGEGGFRVTDSSGSIGFYQEQWDKDLIHSPQLTVHSICTDTDAKGNCNSSELVPVARVSWMQPLNSIITTYNLRTRRQLHMYREVPFSICHTVQGPFTTWQWKRLEKCSPHLRLVDSCGEKMMAALVYCKPRDRRYRAGHLATLKIGASTPADAIDDIVVTALAKLTYQRIHWYYSINKTKPRIAQIAGAVAV